MKLKNSPLNPAFSSMGLLSFCAVVSAAMPSTASAGEVKIYRTDDRTSTLAHELKVASQTAAPDAVQAYVATHRGALGLDAVEPGFLKHLSTDSSSEGFAVRFSQSADGVAIDGAELVAAFNSKGELLLLNSTLTNAGEEVKSQKNRLIPAPQALQSAISAMGIQSLELGEGRGDGLRLVRDESSETHAGRGQEALSGRDDSSETRSSRDDSKLALVWQFSLLDAAGALEPTRVRVYASGEKAGQIQSATSATHSVAPIVIHDASISVIMPGLVSKGARVLVNGKKFGIGKLIGGKVAKSADQQFNRTLEFYQSNFSRDSYDNGGATVHAAVNVKKYRGPDLLGLHQSAAWVGPFKLFIFGAGGKKLDYFEKSLDVIGHEFTHAVIDETSGLEYEKESGALNEHLADLFGVMVQQKYEPQSNPWLVGEGVLKPGATTAAALRDMMNPERGMRAQPRTVSQIESRFGASCSPSRDNDNCGVHINSGIPNRASALIVSQLGWEKTKQIFYQVMTQRLRSTSDFADYRRQVVDECAARLSTADCAVVKQAFTTVGM